MNFAFAMPNSPESLAPPEIRLYCGPRRKKLKSAGSRDPRHAAIEAARPYSTSFHPSTLGEVLRMWETCSVQLNVRLPRDIAVQAEEVQRADPEFLSRVVLYGLTRRSIYRHLRERSERSNSGDEELQPRQ
jgi:hypothetical protein